jgi:hypothetical protein
MRREAGPGIGRDDPRWWAALAKGKLSEADQAVLRAEAEQSEEGQMLAGVAAIVRAHHRARRRRAMLAPALVLLGAVMLACVRGPVLAWIRGLFLALVG